MSQAFVNEILQQYDTSKEQVTPKSLLTSTTRRPSLTRASSSVQSRSRQKLSSTSSQPRSLSRNTGTGRTAPRPAGQNTDQPLAPFTPMSFTASYKSLHPHLYVQSDLPKISFKHKYDLEIVTKKYEEVTSNLNELKQTIVTLRAREDVAKKELTEAQITVESRAMEIADLLCNLRQILPNVVDRDIASYMNKIDGYVGDLCSDIAINRMAGKSQFRLYSKTNTLIQNGPSDNMRQYLYRGINYNNRQADRATEQIVELLSVIAEREDNLRTMKRHLDPLIAEMEFLEAEVEEKTHAQALLSVEEEKERSLKEELRQVKAALLDAKTQINARLTEKEMGKMALPDYLNDGKVIGYVGEHLSGISDSINVSDAVCHPEIKIAFTRLYNYALSLEHLQAKHGIRPVHTSTTSTPGLFATFEKHRTASLRLNALNKDRYNEALETAPTEFPFNNSGQSRYHESRGSIENDIGLPVYETIIDQQHTNQREKLT
ncbi:hypothetical protein GL50803_0010762 [Giardia duodenalis]|uniref:Uncharacterized protein n=1 Tax=Giardia intestinalis (strain ATCC 50803 / WB clone C6) TaxID=184922 RepID=A8BJI8_GIAIC|nr:hypothetical protein GL50803_0010762 [Giardia intestinalis]KAE8303904.1 hypothetical protein GL50803_0010762 [Giardia intestinalis]|eukprot:XP_001706591.1 Hypothetical protein GL50803_10762 [Giardia lamblia ATCC 50803]